MSEDFDGYHKWLGIPPKHQPPGYYRLLAIEQFEDDRDVISHAADQRMIHVRAFQAGEHAALCEKILNEIASARICLLDPGRKAVYDAGMRSQQPWVEPPPPQPPPLPPIAPPTAEPRMVKKPPRFAQRARAAVKSKIESPSWQENETRKLQSWTHGEMAAAAAVILLGIIVFLLVTRSHDVPSESVAKMAKMATTKWSAAPPQSGDSHGGKGSGELAGQTGDQPSPESDDDDDDFPTAGAFTHEETTDKPDAADAKADEQPPAPKKAPTVPKEEPPAPKEKPPAPKKEPPAPKKEPPAGEPAKADAAQKNAQGQPPATLLELTADTVSLPAIDSVEPLELGKAVIKERSDLTIDIEGGHSGHGGKGAFSVAAAAGSDDALAWEIRHGPADGQQAPVARLAIADQKLTFNWLPAAATSGDVPYLQNCLLNLGAGQTTKAMRLREPQRVEPLPIAVIKSGIKPLPFAQEIDFLPDPASVFIELQVDEGTFGPSKFVPQEGRTDNALPADRGTLLILLAEGEAVGLKMESKTSRNKLMVKATPVLRGLQEGQEQKLDYAKLLQAQNKKSKFVEEMNRGLEKMNKVRDDKQPSKKDQKTLAQIESVFQRLFRTTEANVIELELGKLIAQVEHDNKALVYVEGLIGQLQDVLSSGGKKLSLPIEFRVYRTIGAAQVNLLETSGWESAGS